MNECIDVEECKKMANNLILPREIYHGLGTLEKLKEINGTKAVIVTGGSSMERTGTIKKTQEYLLDAGIKSAVFSGVEPDPSLETVINGVEFFNQENPDIIVGLGGCSSIDAAKAMWVFYEYPETKLEDIVPPFTIKPLRKKARFVAIPSTSGTGTEVTCVTVITDKKKGIKYPIVSYEITPDVAIVDGEICKSMPPHVTAHTGLDVLAHDIEAYVSILADDYTDCLSEKSIKMIFNNLKNAYNCPNDLVARQAMHDASCLAGMAFTNALLGLVHAMAHQLGGMFEIPHGCANAILMPNIVRYNSKSTDKYINLANLLNKSTSEEFACEIEKLRSDINVPFSIKEYFEASNLNTNKWEEKLDTITQNAMEDICLGANPRQPSLEDIKNIYIACFEGKRVEF
jgi:alcohol dehydrogenase